MRAALALLTVPAALPAEAVAEAGCRDADGTSWQAIRDFGRVRTARAGGRTMSADRNPQTEAGAGPVSRAYRMTRTS